MQRQMHLLLARANHAGVYNHVVHNTRLNLAGDKVSVEEYELLGRILFRNLVNLPLNRSSKLVLSRSFDNDEKRWTTNSEKNEWIINHIIHNE